MKGQYNTSGFDLCTKCHLGFSATDTGFYDGVSRGNLHTYHLSKMSGIRCNNCHIAVPHGWKHKALLADTRTVGMEVGLASDTEIAGFSDKGQTLSAKGYTRGPYYMNAFLRVTNWKRSRQWVANDCNGGVSGMKGGCQNQ